MAVSFIHTDYVNFAIGSACRANEAKDMHEESFFVWTRDKEPSMYMRRKMRKILVEDLGLVPEDMVKGQNVQCWAEDYYPKAT